MTPPCCFAVIANSPAGWGHPALQGNKKSSRGRGGARPARGFAVMTILRVIRRGGIYAARRSCPDITNHREKPKVCNIPICFIKKFPSPLDKRFAVCYSIFVSCD